MRTPLLLCFLTLLACALTCAQQPSLPKYIVQYGKQRTSSTHQASLLRIIWCLRKDEIRRMQKTHVFPQFFDTNTWYFLSAYHTNETLPKGPWKTVHFRSKLETRGLNYIYHQLRTVYKPLFNLSDIEVTMIIRYFDDWDVLRRCCGIELSRPFGAELLAGNESQKTHPCWRLNATQHERALMHTRVFRECPIMRSTSYHDYTWAGRLDGHYCERTQELYRHGMHFDGKNLIYKAKVLRMPYDRFVAEGVASKCCQKKDKPENLQRPPNLPNKLK